MDVALPDLRIGNTGSVLDMIKKCGGFARAVTTADQLTGDAQLAEYIARPKRPHTAYASERAMYYALRGVYDRLVNRRRVS